MHSRYSLRNQLVWICGERLELCAHARIRLIWHLNYHTMSAIYEDTLYGASALPTRLTSHCDNHINNANIRGITSCPSARNSDYYLCTCKWCVLSSFFFCKRACGMCVEHSGNEKRIWCWAYTPNPLEWHTRSKQFSKLSNPWQYYILWCTRTKGSVVLHHSLRGF